MCPNRSFGSCGGCHPPRTRCELLEPGPKRSGSQGRQRGFNVWELDAEAMPELRGTQPERAALTTSTSTTEPAAALSAVANRAAEPLAPSRHQSRQPPSPQPPALLLLQASECTRRLSRPATSGAPIAPPSLTSFVPPLHLEGPLARYTPAAAAHAMSAPLQQGSNPACSSAAVLARPHRLTAPGRGARQSIWRRPQSTR